MKAEKKLKRNSLKKKTKKNNLFSLDVNNNHFNYGRAKTSFINLVM